MSFLSAVLLPASGQRGKALRAASKICSGQRSHMHLPQQEVPARQSLLHMLRRPLPHCPIRHLPILPISHHIRDTQGHQVELLKATIRQAPTARDAEGTEGHETEKHQDTQPRPSKSRYIDYTSKPPSTRNFTVNFAGCIHGIRAAGAHDASHFEWHVWNISC